jgi:hypothetical protein
VRAPWPRALFVMVAAMCVLMPIFAMSVLAVATIDHLARLRY